ncbi:MAG: RadC family protein [Rubrivivax sp.]|jgi:DNA repair protein RadC|nr:DNA repair protein RadC [Rubrivivax sp.]
MIKDLPSAERPREKLLARGASALADAELLALLLRTGTRGTGVLALAEQVLQASGGFAGLLAGEGGAGGVDGSAGVPAWGRVKGLGPARRAELLAVMEMARRAVGQRISDRPLLQSCRDVREYLSLRLAGLPHEVFCVMFLDHRHHLIAMETMFRGTLTQTSVHPREVVRRALALNASAVLLVHNHPSGVAEPSRADLLLTQVLRQSLQLVDVRVLDHLIVGMGQVQSLAERGEL